MATYQLLNIAGINAQVVYYSRNTNEKMKRRIFLRTLAMELIKPQVGKRAAETSLPKRIREKASRLTGQQHPPQAQRARLGATGRCEVCPRNKDRKTAKSCGKCQKWICVDHVNMVCDECK